MQIHKPGLNSTPDEATSHASTAMRRFLGALLTVIIAVTGTGLWILRPTGSEQVARQSLAAPGTSFPQGVIREIASRDCAELPGAVNGLDGGDLPPSSVLKGKKNQKCGIAAVELLTGPEKGQQQGVEISPELVNSGVGTEVILLRTPINAKEPPDYSIYDQQRSHQVLWLVAAVILIAILVLRLRGFRALIAIGLSIAVFLWYLIPAILSGKNMIAITLLSCTLILMLFLYISYGASVRITTALLGSMVGLATTAGLGILGLRFTKLNGLTNSGNPIFRGIGVDLNLRDLLICGILIAGLGILTDVTLSQSSLVCSLRATQPHLTQWQLYRMAMRKGRDHGTSALFTLLLCYSGISLPVLLLIKLYGQPITQVITNQDIAQEIVRTLISALGLLIAIPITTGLAVFALKANPIDEATEHNQDSLALTPELPHESLPHESLPPETTMEQELAAAEPSTRRARRATEDRRSQKSRRDNAERRSGGDRRSTRDREVQGERRNTADRRIAKDRRAVGERRATRTRARPLSRRSSKAILAAYGPREEIPETPTDGRSLAREVFDTGTPAHLGYIEQKSQLQETVGYQVGSSEKPYLSTAEVTARPYANITATSSVEVAARPPMPTHQVSYQATAGPTATGSITQIPQLQQRNRTSHQRHQEAAPEVRPLVTEDAGFWS